MRISDFRAKPNNRRFDRVAGIASGGASAPREPPRRPAWPCRTCSPAPSPCYTFYPCCTAGLAGKLLCPGAAGHSPSISFSMRPMPRMVAWSGSSATRTGNCIAVASRSSRPARSVPPPERTIPRSAMPPASGSRHFVSPASRSALFASERPSLIRCRVVSGDASELRLTYGVLAGGIVGVVFPAAARALGAQTGFERC